MRTESRLVEHSKYQILRGDRRKNPLPLYLRPVPRAAPPRPRAALPPLRERLSGRGQLQQQPSRAERQTRMLSTPISIPQRPHPKRRKLRKRWWWWRRGWMPPPRSRQQSGRKRGRWRRHGSESIRRSLTRIFLVIHYSTIDHYFCYDCDYKYHCK